MGSRWLISILLTVMLVASPALPARGQPAAPAQPAPPSPPQAPSLGPIPMIPQVPMLAPRPLTLADAITTGLANNFQTRVAALGVAIAREQLREERVPGLPEILFLELELKVCGGHLVSRVCTFG